METQDIPKKNKSIETMTNLFGGTLKFLFGFVVAFSFITSVALAYEGGLVGWAIIGYKLMMIYFYIGIIYFVMIISKNITYKFNKKLYVKQKERRNTFKKELKEEIIKEMKNGRSANKRKSR